MTVTTIGPHRVRLGDVTTGIADLMGGDTADLLYSDPPWGAGNIKYWATMNRKMTGRVVEPAPLDTFLSAIFGIAQRYARRYVLIEYGVRWRDEIQNRGKAAGLTPRGVIDIRYRGTSKGDGLLPLDLHVFTVGAQPIPPGYADGVRGSHGFDGVKRAFGPLARIVTADRPGAIGLDPCCGMGYTAEACKTFGLAFRGNELNEKRLGKTIARLRK